MARASPDVELHIQYTQEAAPYATLCRHHVRRGTLSHKGSLATSVRSHIACHHHASLYKLHINKVRKLSLFP